MTKIVSSAMRGEEPPIELILKHNRGFKNNNNKQKSEADLKAMTLKQLTYQNLSIIDRLHTDITECMDDICDSYAIKYGNECNVQ